MCFSRKDVCEYEDFCFLLCAFLKNLCLVCSFRFHKTHSSLFISFLNILTFENKSLFSPSFFEKTQFSSSRSVLAWPLFDHKTVIRERYKYLKRERISSFTHTKTHLLYKHNVCCYSTNRVHRRPQGHQGSGACAFFFFFSILVLGKRSRRFRGARARFSLNSLFAYPTLKDTKIHTWEKKGPFGDDGNLSLARAREKDPSLRV